MNRLMLANIDYEPWNGGQGHMTDEGMQLQRGLGHAGWTLAGHGFDGRTHVPSILEEYHPDVVLVQDKRDWDPSSGICFNKAVRFDKLDVLGARTDIAKVVVIKDAATFGDFQHRFVSEVKPEAVLVYYHPDVVRRHASYLAQHRLVRTWHTIDAGAALWADTRALRADNREWRLSRRRRALVSGAASECYPMRMLALANASRLGLDRLRHPGYGNHGCATPRFLEIIRGYRVHVCCASQFGFALRKIIESVAMGCTPVTDLPDFDVLPEIDGALVRVAPGAKLEELAEAIDCADRAWDPDQRFAWVKRARAFYDWRAMGMRNDAAVLAAVAPNGQKVPA